MYKIIPLIAKNDWGTSITDRSFTRRELKKFIHRHFYVLENVHCGLFIYSARRGVAPWPATCDSASRKPISGSPV